MITGLTDGVCYPITQFTIYNRLECTRGAPSHAEYEHEAMNVYMSMIS